MSSLTRSMNAGSFRAACHIWPEMGSRAQRSWRGCAATGYSKGVLGWAATITSRQWTSAAHCGIFLRLAPSDRRAGADAARLNAAALARCTNEIRLELRSRETGRPFRQGFQAAVAARRVGEGHDGRGVKEAGRRQVPLLHLEAPANFSGLAW